jgi:hypothetical protein
MEVKDLFSRRNGFDIPETLWETELPSDFLDGLLNVLLEAFRPEGNYYFEECYEFVLIRLGWARPQHGLSVHAFIYHLRAQKWHDVFDSLELIYERAALSRKTLLCSILSIHLNHLLELKNVNWQMSSTGKFERKVPNLQAIEGALQIAKPPFEAAQHHLKKAWEQFNKRPEPDNENCVKDAVAAVESAIKVASGIENGKLKEILRSFGLHPSLSEGIEKLYGYRGDEDGVAHGGARVPDVTMAESELVLTTCAGIVTYIVRHSTT